MRKAEKQREIMVHYGVRLPPAVYNAVLKRAAKSRATVSETVRELLAKALAQR